MSLSLRGRLLTPELDLPHAEVVLEDGVIAAVEELDGVGEAVLLPGLVDLHCHGGGGASFTTGSLAEAVTAARFHRGRGTTTLLGSVVTDRVDRMMAAVSALADAVEAGHLAGIHVEGPFLAASYCGAQDPAHLRDPDPELALRLVEAARGHLRVLTLAPELPGADEVAVLLAAADVVVAAGHTAAPAATARGFLSRPGRDLVTHLFNGMPSLHHREGGPVAGALAAAAAGSAVVELVGDGVHLDDEVVALLFTLLGGDGIALVTDAMAAAGMPDGGYRLGPQQVEVVAGVARLAGSGSIAGGTSSLLRVVARAITAGVDPRAAVRAATRTPARVLGVDVPELRIGDPADVIVAGRDLRPRLVFRGGEEQD